MNAWNRTLFISALALALTAFGCGDDSTTPPTDAATDTSGGGDTGGGDTGGGGGDSAMGDGGMCTPIGMECRMPGDYIGGMMDQCNNADDIAAVNREDYGDMMNESLTDLASACGQSCIADPDLVACTTTCVVEASEMAVSSGCAVCYAASVACAAELCIGDCLTAPDSPECLACLEGDNDCCFDCISEADTCAGFDLSDPPTM